MSLNNTSTSQEKPFESLKCLLDGFISPALCALGIVGNTLNVLVLTRRRMQASFDNKMERSACMGLIALAMSDSLYCLCTLPEAFISKVIIYDSKSFELYYNLYGMYLRNIFSYASTWLTVIMAMSRYVAICHPIHARIFVNPGGTRLAIVMTFMIWCCLSMPEVWSFTMTSISDNNATIHIVEAGPFTKNPRLHRGFTILWSVVGFIIPISILAFCNTELIWALKASYRMRREYRVHQRTQQPNSRITPTLIAIVFMLLLLVTPSEILNIYRFCSSKTSPDRHGVHLAITITNLMHMLNFSISFVLYCIVNVHFRNTLKDIFCGWRKRWSSDNKLNRSQSYASYTNMMTISTRSSAPENLQVHDAAL